MNGAYRLACSARVVGSKCYLTKCSSGVVRPSTVRLLTSLLGLRLPGDGEADTRPPRRDHLLVRLSEVAEARGDLPEAIRWLEAHTRPERRAAWIWRRLGDLQRAAGDLEGALSSWHAAIQKDRMGKHLTWTRLADAHAERGELKRAERTYRKAVDFARKRWSKEHAPALRGLAAVLEARGKDEPAERIHARLRKVEPDRARRPLSSPPQEEQA